MEYILGIAGFVVSVISGVATWYWGTKKKRLIKSIEEHQSKIDTIEQYISDTGYKLILRDCFHTLSYSLAISLIGIGLYLFITTLVTSPELQRFLMLLTSSVISAAGIVLFQQFSALSKTFRPAESIKAHKIVVDKLVKEREKY